VIERPSDWRAEVLRPLAERYGAEVLCARDVRVGDRLVPNDTQEPRLVESIEWDGDLVRMRFAGIRLAYSFGSATRVVVVIRHG
jgi:hypothetical protein